MSTTAAVHRRKLAVPSPASPASDNAAVRAASLHPQATAAGNFVPDPVTLELTERAEHPMLTPSWKSFRAYASNHPEFAELKSQGLVPMMRAHQGLRLAIYAVAASLVLLLAALLAYWWLMPATADADSPYATADSATATSTAAAQWEKGVVPSLYQNDASWAHVPYGQAAMGSTGAAPTALAMAYIATTGDTTYTPVEFAQWATDHDMTAAGVDTVAAYLQQAGAEFGLALEPLPADAHGLRCAIVSKVPVLVVTQPGTFAPAASVVVLDDIDKDSRIILHDPSSPSRSAKSWPFDDIIDATAAAFEVHAA
ncbi:hypothetical protein VJ923_04090 [Adlercreutzia sp. R25]|uniref:hypothetical protein n=1 Tax=Adlercreutzia shanghongiae TaxID=3111773 RepID=UPI002DBCDDA8|nr:hypothetical protein [Adlercreutzia sp. R25]MEC4272340.1 hypothetical protein [Adlercreutzia sp. R25]